MKEEGWAASGDRSAVREGEGSWWAGPSSPVVVVGAGVALSSLAVLVVRWSPVVVRSMSFVLLRNSFVSVVRVRRSFPSFVSVVRVRRSSVLRRWRLASLSWGGVK